jgi:alcohol dehydrogenase class IV
MEQIEIIGWGTLERIAGIAAETKAKRIFLVGDSVAYGASGAEQVINTRLASLDITVFFDFALNPRIEDVEKGVDILRGGEFDLVIAVGGGSVIDMAKLVNIFGTNKDEAVRYVRKEVPIEKRGLPLVAVPTTAGSGSEATHFAVVYLDRQKYSVAHEYILPTYCIVDPALTMSLPASVAASSGIDALAQGMESYWSVNSTDESRAYSASAVELARDHLVASVRHPDRVSRDAMTRAAHFGGKAINISKTTGPHAFSYYLTSHYGVPHGNAVALTLGKFLRFNSRVSEDDVTDRRGAEHVKAVIDDILRLLKVRDVDAGVALIEDLIARIGLETELKNVGLYGDDEIAGFTASINLERLKNNPRRVEAKDVPMILGVE